MTRRIWKFYITPPMNGHEKPIYMPKDARVRCVGMQRGEFFVWAEVDVDKGVTPELEIRTFLFFGTGVDIDQEASVYIGTIHTYDRFGADLVFHVYEQDDGSYKGDGLNA
jgi:hypothetical protein